MEKEVEGVRPKGGEGKNGDGGMRSVGKGEDERLYY